MRVNIKRNVFLTLFIYLFYTLFMLILSTRYNDLNSYNSEDIFILSWFANITLLFAYYIIYRINKKITILHIIITFCYLFNFGQSFFWSLGIHLENEIGTTNLFSNFHIPTYDEIGMALNYTNLCFAFFTLAIIIVLLVGNHSQTCIDIKDAIKKTKKLSNIYAVSKYISFIVVPLTIIRIFKTIAFSFSHGYVALYYSDFSLSSIYVYAEVLFFPVLVGLLIGSNYKKMKTVYLIFCVYAILYLIAGERGSWLYKAIVLLWMHHNFYKKFDYKRIIRYFIIGFLGLYIISFIIEFRNVGLNNVNFDTFISFLSIEKNPFIDFIKEMGGTLGVTLIVLSLGQLSFIMPNTFITSFLASFSSGIASFFGVQEVFLGNYLSQEILHINYGTGFNIFAEGYINGNYIGGVFYAFIIGVIIAMLLKKIDRQFFFNNSIKCIFVCSISPIICSMFRDSSLSIFKQIVQIGIVYIGLIYIFNLIFCEKKIGSYKYDK